MTADCGGSDDGDLNRGVVGEDDVCGIEFSEESVLMMVAIMNRRVCKSSTHPRAPCTPESPTQFPPSRARRELGACGGVLGVLLWELVSLDFRGERR